MDLKLRALSQQDSQAAEDNIVVIYFGVPGFYNRAHFVFINNFLESFRWRAPYLGYAFQNTFSKEY
jgi:hypothetical protein